MSDTDKDKPNWVTTTWWTPDHWRCEHATHRAWPGPWRGRQPNASTRVCDLPAHPVRRRPDLCRRRPDPGCEWSPTYTGRPYLHVPGWFVRHVWTSVERVSVRDDCRRAAAEYRATGTVGVDPSVRQGRHGARWLWE